MTRRHALNAALALSWALLLLELRGLARMLGYTAALPPIRRRPRTAAQPLAAPGAGVTEGAGSSEAHRGAQR